MRCCSCLCQVGNAVRLFHLALTFFVFYVLLTNPHSDLHVAWQRRTGFFVVVVALLSLALLLYLTASCMDPGYLPKPSLSSEAPPSPDKGLTSDPLTGPTLSVEVGSEVVGGRICHLCHAHQPVRARHCGQCGRCVRLFDHHCPWLANCVGERNHGFFWLFLVCETVVLSLGVWVAWSAVRLSGSRHWLGDNAVVFLCLAMAFVAGVVCGLLLLYHSYLMLTGQTTWEHASRTRVHYLKDSRKNPFDEGCCCNSARFVCPCGGRDWEAVYSNFLSSDVAKGAV